VVDAAREGWIKNGKVDRCGRYIYLVWKFSSSSFFFTLILMKITKEISLRNNVIIASST
jgi:hypothetical protein